VVCRTRAGAVASICGAAGSIGEARVGPPSTQRLRYLRLQGANDNPRGLVRALRLIRTAADDDDR